MPRMHTIKLLIMAPMFFASLMVPSEVIRNELPEYRVVLDPGHGGIALPHWRSTGDRYDGISGRYMMQFAEGASYRDLHEHVLVYRVAEKALKILELCGPDGDFERFTGILRKYSDDPPVRINIVASLSRGSSHDREEIKARKDPNSEFRLYDYITRGREKARTNFPDQQPETASRGVAAHDRQQSRGIQGNESRHNPALRFAV